MGVDSIHYSFASLITSRRWAGIRLWDRTPLPGNYNFGGSVAAGRASFAVCSFVGKKGEKSACFTPLQEPGVDTAENRPSNVWPIYLPPNHPPAPPLPEGTHNDDYSDYSDHIYDSEDEMVARLLEFIAIICQHCGHPNRRLLVDLTDQPTKCEACNLFMPPLLRRRPYIPRRIR